MTEPQIVDVQVTSESINVIVDGVNPLDPVDVMVGDLCIPSASILTGVGRPAETFGEVGAFYVDTATGVMYGPKLAAAAPLPYSETLYPLTLAPTAASDTSGGLAYGTVFTPTVAGQITAIRYYRSPGATTAARTLRIWNDTTGANVASVVTSEAGLSGWLSFPLAVPLAVVANQAYVVNYQADAQMAYVAPAPTPTARYMTVQGHRTGATGGVKPTNPTTTYGMIDVVFTPTSVWPFAGLDPIRPAKMDAYTVPGTYTWTKPPGARRVTVVLQQAGGGGGSGRRGAAGTARVGGSGGGGGSWSMTTFAAADLPTSVAVGVATGGAGGAAATADDTDGANGVTGSGYSYFAASTLGITSLRGNAGAAGQAGKLAATVNGSSGPVGTAASQSLAATGAAGVLGVWVGPWAATAGGGGGGLTTANAAVQGGGTYVAPLSNGYNVTPGGTGGTVGGNAPASTYLPTTTEPWPAGTGGGAGGSGSGGVGGNGAPGVRGGGGGGGGASVNGFASGAGGKGGDGYVQVITYF